MYRERKPLELGGRVVTPAVPGVSAFDGQTPPRTIGAARMSAGDRLRLTATDRDPRGSLTPSQRRMVWRLARGDDLATAAALDGVHPERARRWMAIPRFQLALVYEQELPKATAEIPMTDQSTRRRG
jgi:hypothetical protein